MDYIFEKITEKIKEFLISLTESSLTVMFDDVNEKVSSIAAEVSKTPEAWNESVFSIVRSLSQNVILPIAGMIISLVLCYELISMIIDSNNLHDIDTFMFFKYIFKACAAVLVASHTFEIVMGIFDAGQAVVQMSGVVIGNDTSINISAELENMRASLESMGMGELVLLSVETAFVSLGMKIISICISVVLFVRMIEIYLYCSVGAIPFATMMNREWGQIGGNYLRGVMALSFQGFFIMVCVGIYSALVNHIPSADNIHSAIFSVAAYTVVLCFALFKTDEMAKSIFNAR